MIIAAIRHSSSLPILVLAFYFHSLLLLSSAHSQLSSRRLNLRCHGDRGRIVQREFDWAMMMLANAKQALRRPNFIEDPYFRAFFAPAIAADVANGFAEHIRLGVLQPLEAIPKPGTTNYTLTARCRQTRLCRKVDQSSGDQQRRLLAYYNTILQRINFCDMFFEKLPSTDEMRCDRIHLLPLEAYRTKAQTVLHEMIHIAGGHDYAYNAVNCFKLSHGTYVNREGELVPAQRCGKNVDSLAYMIIAAHLLTESIAHGNKKGMYWSQLCGFHIPIRIPHGLLIPSLSPSASLSEA